MPRDKDLPVDVDIHACLFGWIGIWGFPPPKCFAQVLGGEQEKTEELTTATLHKILYIPSSFSSANREAEVETEVQLTKQKDKVM